MTTTAEDDTITSDDTPDPSESTTEATVDPPATSTPPTPPRSGPARYGRAVVLLVVAAALAVTGVLFLVRADSLDSDSALANKAVVDRGATSAVIGQVSTALNQVLSYDYRKPEVAKAAAAKWLTGDAPAQYQVLFQSLQKLARGQQLILAAKVTTAGVVSLKGNTARLLVFVDQQSTRASDNKSSVSGAQVQITAVRVGGTWKIKELKPI